MIKKGDFVELEFVGKLEDGTIFDLNDKEIAKKEGIKETLDRVVVCVGEREVVEGLDDQLEGKKVGKKFNVDVPAEKAFGKKDAKLFQLVSSNKFKEQQVNPYPGLQLNIDGMTGTVKTVSGGRVMIDFNHPLAGRNLKYEVTVKKVITDVNDKIKFSVKNLIGKDLKYEFEEGKITIKAEFPEEIKKLIEEKLKQRIKEIKTIEFKK